MGRSVRPELSPTQIEPPATEAAVGWLLEGDPAVRWQALRDLSGAGPGAVEAARKRVALEGWGARLLALQDPGGTWAQGLYLPKWTSTTYTLLLLRDFGLEPGHPQALLACERLIEEGFYRDGGINFWASYKHSETCVTGMVLSVLAYFGSGDERLEKIADHLLAQQMPDGGWNCRSYRGATHSSFHTTILVLEALRDFGQFSPHRAEEVRAAQERGREFLLVHRLFRSHRTGRVVDPRMTHFFFPPRWHYDILRALDYFRSVAASFDARMNDALEIVLQRRQEDGRWLLPAGYRGKIFFELERAGEPSRWNTLRALRVLRRYGGGQHGPAG